MSQIYKNLAAGPVPPSVPTQFTADDATVAIPVANNLNVLSRETIANNNNGIQTTVDPNGSDNFYIELTNRLFGAVSTNDSTPTTIITFGLGATDAVFTLDGFISGLNTTASAGGGYFFSASVRTDGVTATAIGVEFTSEFEEAGMAAADVNVGVTGNNLIITVTGIPANTIDWLSQCTYSRVI